jgi:hypothetical protein
MRAGEEPRAGDVWPGRGVPSLYGTNHALPWTRSMTFVTRPPRPRAGKGTRPGRQQHTPVPVKDQGPECARKWMPGCGW